MADKPMAVRAMARMRGDKHYRGLLCKEKHDSPRLTSTGKCLECERIRQLEYRRRKNNGA